MEVRISRDAFMAGVHKVQGIVDTKGAMPILSHLLISTDKDGIILQATDLEIGIRGKYPANVVQEGAVAINARKLFDILRELPDLEIHLTTEDNNWLTLKCGKSKFRLPGLSAEEFPSFPEYSEDVLIEFKGSVLREMIRKTQFATSPDETRQALNGLLLEKEGANACLVGTDGHRLALIHRPIVEADGGNAEKLSYLLPKKTLTELMKLVENEDTKFGFSARENHLAFIHGNEVIVSRKIDGKFPNYRQVIPKDNELKVSVNKEELLHALKRVALLADEKSRMVRFEVRPGNLTLISDNTELGAAREEMALNYDGDEVTIGLNAKYVLDVLSVVEQNEVSLNLKDSNHSCLISVDEDEDYLSIVMPMLL